MNNNGVGEQFETSVWKKFPLIFYWVRLFITHKILTSMPKTLFEAKKACQAHHWVFQLRYQNIFIRANKQKNSVKVLTNSKLAAEVNSYSKYSLQPELVWMCVNG